MTEKLKHQIEFQLQQQLQKYQTTQQQQRQYYSHTNYQNCQQPNSANSSPRGIVVNGNNSSSNTPKNNSCSNSLSSSPSLSSPSPSILADNSKNRYNHCTYNQTTSSSPQKYIQQNYYNQYHQPPQKSQNSQLQQEKEEEEVTSEKSEDYNEVQDQTVVEINQFEEVEEVDFYEEEESEELESEEEEYQLQSRHNHHLFNKHHQSTEFIYSELYSGGNSNHDSQYLQPMSDTSLVSPKSHMDGADPQTSPAKSANSSSHSSPTTNSVPLITTSPVASLPPLMQPPPPLITPPMLNNNNNTNNSTTTTTTTSTANGSHVGGHLTTESIDYTARWSILHNKMKCVDDKLDPLKRGSILIEHLSEMNKLAASQVLTNEEEQASEGKESDDVSIGSAHPPSDALVLSGVKLFNDKPRKGIEYFISHNLLDKSTTSISEFLHLCPLLNKRSIGDYLGDSDPFCIEVLESFIARFNFQDLDFDMALRQLLYCFRLPGEAQKIDRIVQKFANQFYRDNIKSGIFEDPDAVYILAFAIILLNTDVHNPVIKPTLTKPKFIKSLSRINNGKDLPLDYVEDLYDRICSDEIKMNPSEAQFPYAVKKGWLYIRVKGKVTEKWSKKWCILSEGSLYFFRKPTDTIPIRYLHPTVITPQGKEVKGRKHCFNLNHSSPPILMEMMAKEMSNLSMKNNKAAQVGQQQQAIFQKMLQMTNVNKDRPKTHFFWDALVEKMGNEINPSPNANIIRLETLPVEVMDTDSVSSVDTLSESSSAAFYDEDVSSISSSSSSPNSPLSTSVPQHGAKYLDVTDPKKKGFSLRFGKEKKEQLKLQQQQGYQESLQREREAAAAAANGNNNNNNNNNNNGYPPNHSLTQPRPSPTPYKPGTSTLMRSSSISTFSTPSSMLSSSPVTSSPLSGSTSSNGSNQSSPGVASVVSSSNSTPSKASPTSSLTSTTTTSSSSSSTKSLEQQNMEHLIRLQQKMLKSSKQTTCILSTESKREMESWTRLILAQFQKQQQK